MDMSRADWDDGRAEDQLLREEAGLTIVLRCRECGEKVTINPDGSETRTCDHTIELDEVKEGGRIMNGQVTAPVDPDDQAMLDHEEARAAWLKSPEDRSEIEQELAEDYEGARIRIEGE